MTFTPSVYNGNMPKLLHRPRMPRPGDPELIKLFADATEQGHGINTAATLAGISGATANDWIRYGTEELADQEQGGELGSHTAFAQAHKEAVARFVARNLGVVNAAIGDAANKKNWVPAMTVLERRQPQDFARRFEAKVETTIDQHVTFSVEALSPERQRALAEHALKRLPVPAGDITEGEVIDSDDEAE